MARTDLAKIKRTAVFVKERRDGKDAFIRRPYDVVEYNWGDGNLPTYLQPHFGRPRSMTLDEEMYDDVRFYSTTPDWDLVCPRRG
jgi:hypothetical protein